MNCPSCGAPMRLDEDRDYFGCDYCKNLYFPEKNEEGVQVLGEPASLHCPVCSVPLLHAAMNGLRLLYCGRCRGMLIRMPVFVALTESLRSQMGGASVIPHPPDPRELKRALVCPQCHKPMETHLYGGPGNVIMDSCSACFLDWLDHNELLRIVRAPDHAVFSEPPMANGTPSA